jgi:hypothetical protein
VTVNDTVIGVLTEHTTTATGTIACAGTPAGGKKLELRVYRNSAGGSLAEHAYLLGVTLKYGITRYSDSLS